MPKPRPSGLRKITPAINDAMSLADEWGTQTAVDKRRAVTAFNRVTHLLRLNSQAIELMNKLLSFSQEQDWTGFSRPIVWPDNSRLVCECSFELSALRRNFRKLAEAGLISFKDSPKGQRFGKRDQNGKIVLASSFGIDLSPLGLKTPELEDLFERDKQRAVQHRELSRKFTISRRLIASIIETASEHHIAGPWDRCARDLQAIVQRRRPSAPLHELAELCDALETLLERVRTAYAAASETFSHGDSDVDNAEEVPSRVSEMTPMGPTSGTFIQSTVQKTDSSLYTKRRSAPAEQQFPSDIGSADENGSEKEPLQRPDPKQPKKLAAKPVDPKTLLLLCPQFKEWVVSDKVPTWADIINTVETVMRGHLLIADSTWNAATLALGREQAAVAVALIFEKHEAGLIQSPGAYLNGIITKAKNGQLALSKSLFHWNKAKDGNRPEGPAAWN